MIASRTARRLAAWIAAVAMLAGLARPLVVQSLHARVPDFAAALCSAAGGDAATRASDEGQPAAGAHSHDLCCLLSCAPAFLVAGDTQGLAPEPPPRFEPPGLPAPTHAPAPWRRAPARAPPGIA